MPAIISEGNGTDDEETSLGNCDRYTSRDGHCCIWHHGLGDLGRNRVILLYIDPGTGFLALQLLAGSFLGAFFVFRKRVLDITAYIMFRLRRKGSDND